jgi:hypothetical protein
MRDLGRVALSLKPLLSARSEALEFNVFSGSWASSLADSRHGNDRARRKSTSHLCSPSRRPPQGRGKHRDGGTWVRRKNRGACGSAKRSQWVWARACNRSRASRSVSGLLRPSAQNEVVQDSSRALPSPSTTFSPKPRPLRRQRPRPNMSRQWHPNLAYWTRYLLSFYHI